MFLSVHLDFGAGILAKQNAIPYFDLRRKALAGLRQLAAADAFHFALLRLFLGIIGNNDAAVMGSCVFQTLDQNLIVEGSNLHVVDSFPGMTAPSVAF